MKCFAVDPTDERSGKGFNMVYLNGTFKKSYSHESRRPDHSKLQGKESIASPLQQPETFTANQTADMLFTHKDFDSIVIIRTKDKIKDADQASHTNTALTTKPTVQVIRTIQQVTDGDSLDIMEKSYEQRHLKEPIRSHSHSHRPTTTDTNTANPREYEGIGKGFHTNLLTIKNIHTHTYQMTPTTTFMTQGKNKLMGCTSA